MLKHLSIALFFTGSLALQTPNHTGPPNRVVEGNTTGFTPSELHGGGPAHERWSDIERGLIEKANTSIAIHPLTQP
jgi:hypothetical protein